MSLHVGVSPVMAGQRPRRGEGGGGGGEACARPHLQAPSEVGACIGAYKPIEAGRRACPDWSLLTVRGPDEAGPGKIFVRAGGYGGLLDAGGRGCPPAAPPVLFPPRARHMTEVGAADDPMEVHDA